MRVDDRQSLLRMIATFAQQQPGMAPAAGQFTDFVHAHPHCCERTLDVGHLTGSAWLVDAEGERVLLTHHRKLGRWLQLGGHADGDCDLAQVALREAREESGLRRLSVEPELFDLDRHWIPTRGGELGHWHYDLRFVVRANGTDAVVVSDESHALAWRPIRAMAEDSTLDESLARMARRWRAQAQA